MAPPAQRGPCIYAVFMHVGSIPMAVSNPRPLPRVCPVIVCACVCVCECHEKTFNVHNPVVTNTGQTTPSTGE